MRALSKAERITDAELRTQLEKKLTRLQNALSKITPKRGASVIALEEASKLVSRFVTNCVSRRKSFSRSCAACAISKASRSRSSFFQVDP